MMMPPKLLGVYCIYVRLNDEGISHYLLSYGDDIVFILRLCSTAIHYKSKNHNVKYSQLRKEGEGSVLSGCVRGLVTTERYQFY